MLELTLPPGLSPREKGRAHGEHFRDAIHEIASIRVDLALEQGKFGSIEALNTVARAHLPILAGYDRALSEELLGIAEGAELSEERTVVLNHYTDLKDIDSEDCSSIVTGTAAEGPLLAQTWDMHGSAEPFVCLLHVPAEDDRPAVCAFTITGCLALAGLNDAGLGIAINNLKSHDARVGVIWPALIRRLLVERSTRGAQHVLVTAPMSSGHHYLIADADRAVAIETSGALKDVVYETEFASDPPGSFIHTNHCVSESVGAVSWVSESSTSYERYAWLEASTNAKPIATKLDLWERMGSHDGYPRSLCTHLASPETPHAMKTCGGLLIDLRARTLFAHSGCLHEAEPIVRGFP